MAHNRYYNNIVCLNEIMYESHMDLIKSICIELEVPEKISLLQEKFLEKVKIKTRRDPDKPKKSKTSYMFFCDENRVKIISDDMKMKLGEQSKLLGKAWSECKDRDTYIKKAEEDKNRYDEEIEEYLNNTNVY